MNRPTAHINSTRPEPLAATSGSVHGTLPADVRREAPQALHERAVDTAHLERARLQRDRITHQPFTVRFLRAIFWEPFIMGPCRGFFSSQ